MTDQRAPDSLERDLDWVRQLHRRPEPPLTGRRRARLWGSIEEGRRGALRERALFVISSLAVATAAFLLWVGAPTLPPTPEFSRSSRSVPAVEQAVLSKTEPASMCSWSGPQTEALSFLPFDVDGMSVVPEARALAPVEPEPGGAFVEGGAESIALPPKDRRVRSMASRFRGRSRLNEARMSEADTLRRAGRLRAAAEVYARVKDPLWREEAGLRRAELMVALGHPRRALRVLQGTKGDYLVPERKGLQARILGDLARFKEAEATLDGAGLSRSVLRARVYVARRYLGRSKRGTGSEDYLHRLLDPVLKSGPSALRAEAELVLSDSR